MKNSCSNIPCKSSDDFEIALHLFQEYANSLGFSLFFQGFDQELEFLPGKYASPQGCILLARDKSVSVGCELQSDDRKKLYQKMQLDTLSSIYKAIGLYKFLGYVVTTPY